LGYSFPFPDAPPGVNNIWGGPQGSSAAPLGQLPQNGYNFLPGPQHEFRFNGFSYPVQGFPIYQLPQHPNASGPGYNHFTGPPMFQHGFPSRQPGDNVSYFNSQPTLQINGNTTSLAGGQPLVKNTGRNFSVTNNTITKMYTGRTPRKGNSQKAKKAESERSDSAMDESTESEEE